MQRDLCTAVELARGIAPAAVVTDNTAVVSAICDLAGFD